MWLKFILTYITAVKENKDRFELFYEKCFYEIITSLVIQFSYAKYKRDIRIDAEFSFIVSLHLLSSVLYDDVAGVNDSGDKSKDGEDYIDQQIGTASTLQKHTKRLKYKNTIDTMFV